MRKFLLLTVLLSTHAYSYTQNNALVGVLGVQGSSIYFKINSPFLTDCRWGNIYFSNNTDFGKAAYANILAAKSSGKKLSRLDYEQVSSGEVCTLTLVEVEQ